MEPTIKDLIMRKNQNGLRSTIYLFLLLVLTAYACGDDTAMNPSQPDACTGTVAVQAHWKMPAQHSRTIERKSVVCGDDSALVSTVEIYVYDVGKNPLAMGGPFQCDAGQGTVKGVPAGVDRRIVLVGKNSDGVVVYAGQKDNVRVQPGAATDPINIDAFVFTPENFRVEADDQQIRLTFDPVDSADIYHLYWRDETGKNGKITQVQSGDAHTGLTNGQTYYYRVVAENGGGEGPPSAEVSAIPMADPPAAPDDLSVIPGAGQVTVQFGEVPGAESYNLYWQVGGTGPVDLQTANLQEGIESGYVHTGLTNGETYHYVVTSVGPGGESVVSSEVSAVPETALSAPTDVHAIAHTRKVTIEFAPAPNADGYRLYRGTSVDDLVVVNDAITSGGEDTGLINGRTYYYAVSALSGIQESALSAIFSVVPDFSSSEYTIQYPSDYIQDSTPSQYGSFVAIDGDYLAVGAPSQDDNNVAQTGVVYVFHRTEPNRWDSVYKISNPNLGLLDWFGYVGAISGDFLAVGALMKSVDVAPVYVYHRIDSNQWELSAQLELPDITMDEYYTEKALAMGPDYVVVGAPLKHLSSPWPLTQRGEFCGAAYIFHRNSDNTWSDAEMIAPSTLNTNHKFGYALATHENRVIIGAPGGNAAYIFRRSEGGLWINEGRITPSGVAMTGHTVVEFGRRVDLYDEYAVVGAIASANPSPLDETPTTDDTQYMVYLFQRAADNSWEEIGILDATAVQAIDKESWGFGFALNGETLAISDADTLQLFRYKKQQWQYDNTITLIGRLIACPNSLMYPSGLIEMSNDSIAVGWVIY